MTKQEKRYQPSAEVYAKYLSMTSAFTLLNGGIYAFVWPWSSWPSLGPSLPESFWTPVNVPGLVALVSLLFIYGLEFTNMRENMEPNLQYWSKIILYTGIMSVVGMQFTLIPAATCLFFTIVVLFLAFLDNRKHAAQVAK